MANFPYFKEAVAHFFSRPSTEPYPKVKKPAPPHYRGRIKFHPERCINCGLCIKVCAPAAIVRKIEKQEDGDRVTMEFHMDSCTFCQMCADFCSKNSIELTGDYEMVASDPHDLIESGSFLKKKPAPKAVADKADKQEK